MTNLFSKLIHDEAGFIVSAELVLVATVGVLSMIVGLSEIALNVNNELEDVGSAFGAMNQTFVQKGVLGHQGYSGGTEFKDNVDHCDSDCDIQPLAPHGEF